MEDKPSSEPEKKTMQRSAAYPGISLEDSIDFVDKVKKVFPNSGFKRDDIGTILKKSTVHIDLSASVQYGLIERSADIYKLSARVVSIVNPVTESEKHTTIQDCFKSPKLYVELIEKFKGHVVPPDQQFKAILTRFHGITENAVNKVAEVFIENATYAGLLNEHRILTIGIESEKTEVEQNNSFNPETLAQQAKDVNPQTPKKEEPKGNQLLLEKMNNSKEISITLSEKKVAYLIYPDSLNERDIKILKLTIDALELTL